MTKAYSVRWRLRFVARVRREVATLNRSGNLHFSRLERWSNEWMLWCCGDDDAGERADLYFHMTRQRISGWALRGAAGRLCVTKLDEVRSMDDVRHLIRAATDPVALPDPALAG